MSEYDICVGYWVRAYDHRVITADNDDAAVEAAKALAVEIMNADEPADHVEYSDRHDGTILWVDALDADGDAQDRDPVAECIAVVQPEPAGENPS